MDHRPYAVLEGIAFLALPKSRLTSLQDQTHFSECPQRFQGRLMRRKTLGNRRRVCQPTRRSPDPNPYSQQG